VGFFIGRSARIAIQEESSTPMKPFHIMAKPHGPICNLNCTYCYYLEKENLYTGSGREFRMADDVLDAYIRQYIQSQPDEHVSFAWQGGEPTLLGIPFFERVVELQKQHANGKIIDNAFQTNGTLLATTRGSAFNSKGRRRRREACHSKRVNTPKLLARVRFQAPSRPFSTQFAVPGGEGLYRTWRRRHRPPVSDSCRGNYRTTQENRASICWAWWEKGVI